jgi:antitoxin VapB
VVQILKNGQNKSIGLPEEDRDVVSDLAAQHFGGGTPPLAKNNIFANISASLTAFEPELHLTRKQPEQKE